MLKKVLLPLILLMLAVMVFLAVAAWYESKYGSEGPFPSDHHH